MIIIRLLSNVVGIQCQWTVTAKMLNVCMYRNKKLDKPKSPLAVSRCILKAAVGRWSGIRSRQAQRTVEPTQWFPLSLQVPTALDLYVYIYVHPYIFPQSHLPLQLCLISKVPGYKDEVKLIYFLLWVSFWYSIRTTSVSFIIFTFKSPSVLCSKIWFCFSWITSFNFFSSMLQESLLF